MIRQPLWPSGCVPFHQTKGAIFLILWLIVGSTIFITGSGLCTAGWDLSLSLSLPVDSRRTWYCFEGVHTTITQFVTDEAVNHCVQAPSYAVDGHMSAPLHRYTCAGGGQLLENWGKVKPI